jgi:hypothetical protein
MKPIETLICMLTSHFVKYVIINGVLYAKGIVTYKGLTFEQYTKINRENIYDFLGY